MSQSLLVEYPFLLLAITIVVYWVSLRIYQASNNNVLLLPIVSGITLMIGILLISDIQYEVYFDSVKIIHFLLGTATVALAVPLRNNIHLIREHAIPLTLSLVLMAIVTPTLAVLSAWFFGAEKGVLLSLAPKSISTPFAISVAESIGGYPPLVAAIVIITGIFVAMIASIVFKVCSIHDPITKGFSMGLVGHGVGTAAAFEMGAKEGAFSALAMGLMGLLTSIVLPYLVVWIF